MKLVTNFFIVTFLISGFWSASVFAQTDDIPQEKVEYIHSLASDITVGLENSISVQETIVYDFGDEMKHGIFRYIPLSKAPGTLRNLRIEEVWVTDEKGNEYTTEITGGNPLYIKIGDAGTLISGVHTYKISYVAKNAIGYFDDRDEMYWNVSGDEWQVPISEIEATIHLPALIPLENLHLYTYCGVYGDTSPCGNIETGEENGKTTLHFSSDVFAKDTYFYPGQGMTIAVGFPKGIVAADILMWWEKIETYYYAAAGLFTIILLRFLGWLLLKHLPLRRSKQRPIIAEYEPPADMTPAHAGLILRNIGLGTMASADILYLASNGYITIAAKEDAKNIVFKKAKMLIPLGFVLLLMVLFAKFALWVIPVAVIINIQRIKNWLREIQNPLSFSFVKTNAAAPRASDLEKLFSIITCKGAVTSLTDIEESNPYKSFRKYLLSAQDKVIESNTEISTDEKPSSGKKAFKIFYLLFLIIFIIPFLVISGMLASFGESFGTAIVDFFPQLILLSIGIIAEIIVLWILRAALTRRLARQTDLWYKVMGLKEYIRVAEKDRLKFESNPEDSQRIFSKLLPYALAFGMEKRWTKIFSKIIPSPEWYQGPSNSLASGAFASSLHTMGISLSGASMAGAPRSSGSGSSGSSGGGSSGGGGGGGGGGSW